MAKTDDVINIKGLSSDRSWDWENGFYWFSDPSRINKFLAHYELYQMITDLPGDIFELGVFKGASLIRWATFRAALETEQSRRIVGFDAFGKFPKDGVALKADLDFIEQFEGAAGDGLSEAQIAKIFALKGIGNVHTVAGNVLQTLPEYLARAPAARIAMLHLDMDVKEPTVFALDALYDRIVPGGLIVVDDYTAVAGATEAIDAFVAARGLLIEKLPLYSVPAFIQKPGPGANPGQIAASVAR
ncbi:MAG: TylF/MycF/NovP-related O-methyltransferase [Halocynthiibacter sp.]